MSLNENHPPREFRFRSCLPGRGRSLVCRCLLSVLVLAWVNVGVGGSVGRQVGSLAFLILILPPCLPRLFSLSLLLLLRVLFVLRFFSSMLYLSLLLSNVDVGLFSLVVRRPTQNSGGVHPDQATHRRRGRYDTVQMTMYIYLTDDARDVVVTRFVVITVLFPYCISYCSFYLFPLLSSFWIEAVHKIARTVFQVYEVRVCCLQCWSCRPVGPWCGCVQVESSLVAAWQRSEVGQLSLPSFVELL